MQEKTNIVFLILPEVHLLDIAGADQVFLEAKEMGVSVQISYCGTEKSVETSAGLALGSLPYFTTVPLHTGDYLFIPGSSVDYLLNGKMKNADELYKWLHFLHEKGVFLCSVCSGAFVLAQAGLLKGRKCTTHWKRTAQLQRLFPEVQVTENILFSEDSGIYTSAGVTAGIDMALHILSVLCDDHIAFSVARELVVYLRRDGNTPQHSILLRYRNHIHGGIHRVQDYLNDHIDQRNTLDILSDIACMSSRNLTRVFKKETGISVNHYMTLIRKEKLQQLQKNPDVSRSQMAASCGLKSERQIMRLIHNI